MEKVLVFDFFGVIYKPSTGLADCTVLQIIASLKEEGYSLYLFTNTNPAKVEKINEMINFLKYFEKIVYSSEFPKPDPKAFENLIKTIQVEPRNIVYIDDHILNISTAEQFGIIGIHYTNPKDLKNNLKEIRDYD